MQSNACGKKLRELRGSRTQKEVGDAIGVNPNTISMYESGERRPSDELKIKLAQFFGVSVGYIFFAE